MPLFRLLSCHREAVKVKLPGNRFVVETQVSFPPIKDTFREPILLDAETPEAALHVGGNIFPLLRHNLAVEPHHVF